MWQSSLVSSEAQTGRARLRGSLGFLRGTIAKSPSRTATRIYLNVLVKDSDENESEKSNNNSCSAMLIDYETVSHSYRGFDFGGHFNERMSCYDQRDSQLTSFAAPDVNEQRSFCESYLREMRELGEDDVSSDIDTVDHLLLEASIGRLYHLLHTTAMCTVYDEVETDPLFLPSLVHTILVRS
jgi:hypothetical protein